MITETAYTYHKGECAKLGYDFDRFIELTAIYYYMHKNNLEVSIQYAYRDLENLKGK